jgi:hypothetical protein
LVLVFVLTFAILEKTKLFGEGKSQSNAVLSLVIALIFVGAVFPKIIVANLVQYMSVALFVFFVVLMLWGFVSGNKDLTVTDDKGLKIHKVFAFLIFGSLTFAILWATGFGSDVVSALEKVFNGLFRSAWSSAFWTNFVIVGIILVIVLIVIGKNPFKFKSNPWIRLKSN